MVVSCVLVYKSFVDGGILGLNENDEKLLWWIFLGPEVSRLIELESRISFQKTGKILISSLTSKQ